MCNHFAVFEKKATYQPPPFLRKLSRCILIPRILGRFYWIEISSSLSKSIHRGNRLPRATDE
jgi:hypothetical protein